MVKEVIKILSFDPGLTCTAWALSEYNTQTGKLFVIRRGKIEGKKSLDKNKELLTIYTPRIVQLSALKTEVELLARFNPDYVVTEAAFCKPGRILAYAALILCIHVIELAIKCELNLPTFKLAPRLVKKLATHDGGASKLTVQETVLNSEMILLKETKQNPIEKMSEHEADAIIIAYAFATETLPAQLSCA